MIRATYISDLPTTIINESQIVSLQEAALFMTNLGDKYAYFDFKSKLNCFFLVIQTRELNAAGVVIKEGNLYLPNIFIKANEVFTTEEPLPLEKDCHSLELYIKYAEFEEKYLYNDQKISKRNEEILLATKTFMPNLTPEVGMANAPVDMSWVKKKGEKKEKMHLSIKLPKMPKPFKKKKGVEEFLADEPVVNPNAEIAKLQEDKGVDLNSEPFTMGAPEPMAQEQQPAPEMAMGMPEQAQGMPMQGQEPQMGMPGQNPEMPMQENQAMPNQNLPIVKAKVIKRKPIVAIAIAVILFVLLFLFVIYYQALFVNQAQ